jgi:RNA polymerase sigma-70 factor (ECF subfamily)
MPMPGDKQALEAILQRAAAGDQAAWRQVIDAYSGRVYGLVRAQCGNNDLAEEITQSTFCTVIAKLAEYTESGKFEPWLFRIAMNRLRDEMRRRKRHATSLEDEVLASLASPTAGRGQGGAGTPDPGASEILETQADLAMMRNALNLLPEADQRIVHLRHCAELSFKQIADVLDQPVGTVLARHHRALKKLREIMLRQPQKPGEAGED